MDKRERDRFKDFEGDNLQTTTLDNNGVKNKIAFLLEKDITDLRFTPVSVTGEPGSEEWVVDYYGLIYAVIIQTRAFDD